MKRAAVIAILAISVVLFSISLHGQAGDGQKKQCAGCHSALEKRIAENPYVHQPVREGECKACHLPVGSYRSTPGSDSAVPVQNEPFSNLKSIDVSIPSVQHAVRLRNVAQSGEYQYRIHAIGQQGVSAVTDLEVFTHDSINREWRDDGGSLQITGAVKSELRPGVFWSVVIEWKTNKLANSKVEYGTAASYGMNAGSDNTFSNEHKVKIGGLKKDQEYHFRAVSSDLSSRDVRSGDQTFQTTGAGAAFKSNTSGGGDSKPSIRNVEVVSLGKSDVIIMWKTDHPTKGRLEYGVLDSPSSVNSIKSAKASSMPSKPGHERMANLQQRGTEACYECHSKSSLGVSHPVDLRPSASKGSRIPDPDKLPTGSGGLVLCASCHDPHAADNSGLLRMEEARALCIACHDPESL